MRGFKKVARDLQMSCDAVISANKLSKCYQMYAQPQDRLKQALWRGRKRFYKEFWALREASFKVEKGETVGIIGRNGSGKSTLLQMICGTLASTTGSIEVHGRVAALLELGAGFNPEFTGRENVYMNAALMGLSRGVVEKRIDDILGFAGIGDFIDQPVKTYSSGMYVRLAFAVIAHVDADILIIDEALAVGDGFFTQKCMRYLRQFKEKGTILFVSHDVGAVLNLCDRAIWLEGGVIKTVGAAKEVCEAYLASLHEQQRKELGVAEFSNNDSVGIFNADQVVNKHRAPAKDQRLDYINHSRFRNDMEIFSFAADKKGFGVGGAKVQHVEIRGQGGEILAWVVGGSPVVLVVQVAVLHELSRPIVGFFVKDKLGQLLFGDNTYLSYVSEPVSCGAGMVIEASFHFMMPILPSGEYSIDVAVADGTQNDHVQHHWLHDALMFRAHTSSVSTGLLGIPMQQIGLRRLS